ncbi:MAG: 2OG-Fe(II) oxygenase [Myxococcales bacterium]|nr:2OG-Fe(II) oxygenase [Myxococcales bacterium]
MFAPYNRERLRQQFSVADPFPFVEISPFLEPEVAQTIADSYPSIHDAAQVGKRYKWMSERGKVEVTDVSVFPDPVLRLHNALTDPSFLSDLEFITGISGLLADPTLNGGGMHMTGSRGRLDVHVDFNFVEETQLHRRLNLLLYLNEDWQKDWGGAIELWNPDVQQLCHSFSPVMNRCIIFATSEMSFHGVSMVSCPPDVIRKSYASYFYTKEAPEDWDGVKHNTVFKPRPDEQFRANVLYPMERTWRKASKWTTRAVYNTNKAITDWFRSS